MKEGWLSILRNEKQLINQNTKCQNSPAVGSRTQNSLITFFSLLIINVWDLYNDI